MLLLKKVKTIKKSEVKNIISKYVENIEIEFYFNLEEDGELGSLNITAWCDETHIILETVVSGTDKELERYMEYDGLKNSFISKYDNWINWFKSNYSKAEIV